MSIPGIIDAMRSSYPPAVRLVWQCYENQVNEARCCSVTDEEVARELGFSVDTVSRANALLKRDRIARFIRHKRRRTTVYMLRSYRDGCPKRPRYEPEVERWIEPELTAQFADSSAELTPQIPDSKSPPVRIHQEGEERAPSAPAPVSSPVSIQPAKQEESRIEQGPAAAPEPPRERATRWHHDVTRDPDIRRTIIEAGHDPDELTAEIAVWAEAQSAPPVRPWVAFTQRWIALKPRFDGRRGSASKPARRPQDVAAERMLRDAVAAGFQGFGVSFGVTL
jgi:hypothetical protein